MPIKAALIIVAALLAATLAVLALAYARTDTYLGRWFAWRASDVGDAMRFPYRTVRASSTPRSLPSDSLPLLAQEVSYSWRGETRTAELAQLLDETGSSAFLVLVDGAVVTEWYGAGYARDVPVTSFSIAKSVTGLLVLAALEDGHLSSLDDPVTAYLPELRAVDPGYDAITLRHLLGMRSGVRFRDHDLPWGDKARVYYEPHLRELVMSLPVQEPAGGGFAYNSYNPVLLGLVLERATGVEPALYLERRVWAPLGAEHGATWSTSREGETLPKMESGLNAMPIDFVKLGLALIGQGKTKVDGIDS